MTSPFPAAETRWLPPGGLSRYDEGWFRHARLSPERWAVYVACEQHEEGLGPRAYRCLIQLADGTQPSPNDVEWLTDGVELPSIAGMVEGRCRLTAYGRLLADAADRGDAEAVFALTTVPELMEHRS